MKLSQVRLLVDDPAAAFRFYRDELGLEPGWGEEGEAYASFAAGDGTVAIFVRDAQGETIELRQPGDGAVVVLEVDDAAAAAKRFGDRVVSGPTERKDWGGRVVYLRDPSGNLIELFEPIPME